MTSMTFLWTCPCSIFIPLCCSPCADPDPDLLLWVVTTDQSWVACLGISGFSVRGMEREGCVRDTVRGGGGAFLCAFWRFGEVIPNFVVVDA